MISTQNFNQYVRIEANRDNGVATIVLERPERRNAVDRLVADALSAAFQCFEAEPAWRAAVLFGAGGTFCAGADLSALADDTRRNEIHADGSGPGPMGPTRMHFTKPVIAAITGYAVAGGLELAAMCDLRVVEEEAVLGVFCRRVGIPLIDGGTIRLPRLIGMSRALDLILTGRAVSAQEALAFGLANRVVAKGEARAAAEQLPPNSRPFRRRRCWPTAARCWKTACWTISPTRCGAKAPAAMRRFSTKVLRAPSVLRRARDVTARRRIKNNSRAVHTTERPALSF